MKKVTMGNVEKVPVDMPEGGLFVGTQVWRRPLVNPGESKSFNFSVVAFDAGSKNKFHTHTGDQILVVTEGTGKVGTKSETLTITEGDIVLIPAGEDHWHGAPDATPMAHITIQPSDSKTTQTEP